LPGSISWRASYDLSRQVARTIEGGVMEMADTAQESLPCVVEGRMFEVGPSKPVEFIDKIGYVHQGPIPHTILGDPVTAEPKSIPGGLAPEKHQ
jgi:hypothetical protein